VIGTEKNIMTLKSMHNDFLKLALSTVTLFSLVFISSVHAQESNTSSLSSDNPIYSFSKKRYSIDGTAKIVRTENETRIVFDDAFKTRGGPDLKVYLSKKPLSEIQNENVSDNSVKISVLRSKKGAQSYIIPENIDLSDYKSVLIHCEAFEVLWGGFDL
jgi:hypothetical protein